MHNDRRLIGEDPHEIAVFELRDHSPVVSPRPHTKNEPRNSAGLIPIADTNNGSGR